MAKHGDYNYNGIPIFNVGFNDFHLFYNSLNENKRILSKKILNESLQTHYRKSRDNDFGISYQGVIVDMRDYKENKQETEVKDV